MTTYDILFRGATLFDGTGAPRRAGADVAVAGDRIVAVGEVGDAAAEVEVDAAGLGLAPGFVDVHTHDDRALLSSPEMPAKTSQGVTTVVVGNCGISLAPLVPTGRPPPPLDLLGGEEWYRYPSFAAFMSEIDGRPAATNAVFLVGHQTLRVGCMDRFDRAAGPHEIEVMRGHVEEAMRAGAAGLSTGLFYPPARDAPTAEIVELARAVAPHGGLYATHLRDEGPRLLESVDEALEIGGAAGIPVVLSHHKASGKANHGKVRDSLAKVREAAKRQPVSLDVYPYAASSTVLLAERLADSTRVLLTWSEPMPDAAGRDLADLAAEHGVSMEEMVTRLQPAGAVYFAMAEEDVQMVLRYEDAMIGSDGIAHDRRPHPRLWGTFPRVLGHYARDLGLMPVEEAVRRMSGLPAERFRLADRGFVREGCFADLVLFDPETVVDMATFENPMQPAAGIRAVYANGRPIWQDGAPTGERPGKVLRRA